MEQISPSCVLKSKTIAKAHIWFTHASVIPYIEANEAIENTSFDMQR